VLVAVTQMSSSVAYVLAELAAAVMVLPALPVIVARSEPQRHGASHERIEPGIRTLANVSATTLTQARAVTGITMAQAKAVVTAITRIEYLASFQWELCAHRHLLWS